MTERVLVVEDDIGMGEMTKEVLEQEGYAVTTCTLGAEAQRRLAEEEFDVLVADVRLPDLSGLELCEHVTGNRPDVPVILMTAFGSMDMAVAALRAGAYDFVSKPLELETLLHHVRQALRHRRLDTEVRRLREEVAQAETFEEMVGKSRGLAKVQELVRQLGPTDLTVLISGESGTGKELVARALHHLSDRKDGPFVAVNCAAMPETLLESELFGHAAGAFTGARRQRNGLFVQASGGTLLLDEIGEMPAAVQPKLLRALQEDKVRPVGGDRDVSFDTRLLVATNRDLDHELEAGRFREDLYFRVKVAEISLPPLRQRENDALILAQHFLQQFAEQHGKPVQAFSRSAAEQILRYDWPGNVRELRNAVERAVALTSYDQILLEDLPDQVRATRRSRPRALEEATGDPAELGSLAEVEARHIERVLRAVRGNKSQAARILGIDRRTLYRKLDREVPVGE